MRFGQPCGVATSLAVLALLGEAAVVFAQPVPMQPPPEAVAKLVGQLGAAGFRVRQQASDQLEKLGAPALPALRKAAAANADLEVKRRIELVVTRIENALLAAEEKNWQALGGPRRGVKDRLVKVLARTPDLSDGQVAAAVYLLATGRPPTDDEVAHAQKQFAQADGRRAGILRLTRSLLQGKTFSAEVAAANGRLLKLHKGLGTEKDLLLRLNSDEFQKAAGEFAATLNKAVKADGPIVDLAFLLVLSRFPRSNEVQVVVAHLKKARDRSAATTDIVWALVNTGEFWAAR